MSGLVICISQTVRRSHRDLAEKGPAKTHAHGVSLYRCDHQSSTPERALAVVEAASTWNGGNIFIPSHFATGSRRSASFPPRYGCAQDKRVVMTLDGNALPTAVTRGHRLCPVVPHNHRPVCFVL